MNSHIKIMVDEAIGLLQVAAAGGSAARPDRAPSLDCMPAGIAETGRSDFETPSGNFEALLAAMDRISVAARGITSCDPGFTIKDRSEQDRLMRLLARITKRLSEVMMDVNTAAPSFKTSGLEQPSITVSRIAGEPSITEEIARQANLLSLNVRLLKRRDRPAAEEDFKHWQPRK